MRRTTRVGGSPRSRNGSLPRCGSSQAEQPTVLKLPSGPHLWRYRWDGDHLRRRGWGGGADLRASVVLILGGANLIADGFSMAVSNFLGLRAQHQQLERARRDLRRPRCARPPYLDLRRTVGRFSYERQAGRATRRRYRLGPCRACQDRSTVRLWIRSIPGLLPGWRIRRSPCLRRSPTRRTR